MSLLDTLAGLGLYAPQASMSQSAGWGDPTASAFAALYNNAFGGGSPYSPGAWGSALSAVAGGGDPYGNYAPSSLSGGGTGAYGIGGGLFGGFGGGGLTPYGGNGASLNTLFRHALAQLNSNSIPWQSYGPPAPQ